MGTLKEKERDLMESQISICSVQVKQEPEVNFLLELPEFQPSYNTCSYLSLRSTEVVKSIESRENMTRKTAESQSLLGCNLCNRKYKTKGALQFHEKSTHNFGGQLYSCDKCSYQGILKAKLSFHMRVHSKPFKCLFCDERFSDMLSLEKHVKEHDGPKEFNCFCGKKFTSNRAIKIHKIKKHDEDCYKVKPFTCDICPYAAKFQYLLERHKRIHNKFLECPHCGKKFIDQKRLNLHVSGPRKCRKLIDFSCQICKKFFKSLKTLRQHLKSHAEREKCPACLRMVSASFLKEHIRRHEIKKKEEMYKCEMCMKLFPSARNLKLHKVIHDKRLTCDLCGYTRATKKFLLIHILKHLDPKASSCKICLKVFSDKHKMLRHKGNHCTETKKTCPICSKKLEADNMFSHIKKHEIEKQSPKFRCEVCDKKFFIYDLLRTHEITHSKSIECDFCGKKYQSKDGYFEEHLKRHINPELFKCLTCQKEYSTQNSLKHHLEKCSRN